MLSLERMLYIWLTNQGQKQINRQLLNASQMHVIQSRSLILTMINMIQTMWDDIPLIRLKNVWDHIDSNNLDLVTQLESDMPTQETY